MSYPEFANLDILDQTGESPTAALIFLHGAGETGTQVKNNFKKYMGSQGHPYFKMYFPTAKERYLKIRDTKTTYWFDAVRYGSVNGEVDGNLEDAERVTDDLEKLINEIEATGIARDRIALGGCSQGGMICLYAVYSRGVKVAAAVGIAATLMFYKHKPPIDDSQIPLLSLYGGNDAYISPEFMNLNWSLMRKHGVPFVPSTFMKQGHTMNVDYTKAMMSWLEKKIPEEID